MSPLAEPVVAAIQAAWRAEREAQGDLGLSEADFVAFVAETVTQRAGDGHQAALELVGRLALGDLYLAQAALRGHPRAVQRLFAETEPYIRERCARVADRAVLARDAADDLLASLITPRQDDDPYSARLWRYRGIGSLKGWLKVTARRLVVDHARKQRHHADDAVLDRQPAPDDAADERLVALDGAARLRPLFVDCVGALDESDVRLLRKSYRDNLVLREIAEEYGVQPSTIFRRLGKIRARIWTTFTRRAEAELGLSPAALREQLSALAAALDLDDLLHVALVLAGALPLPGRPR
ncbi:MAG: hypothetical protein H6702_25410 [Myxococcales bacterium]|nr:hypothetical protein [Myxococcales bacterium]